MAKSFHSKWFIKTLYTFLALVGCVPSAQTQLSPVVSWMTFFLLEFPHDVNKTVTCLQLNKRMSKGWPQLLRSPSMEERKISTKRTGVCSILTSHLQTWSFTSNINWNYLPNFKVGFFFVDAKYRAKQSLWLCIIQRQRARTKRERKICFCFSESNLESKVLRLCNSLRGSLRVLYIW